MPIDTYTGIFYEIQSGGLCRMHSINAFFGKSKISVGEFHKYIKMYDKYLRRKFNIYVSSGDFDLVNSDQTNLVSFILKKHKVHVKYYALNALYGKKIGSELQNAGFIFVYDANHIWGIRKIKGKHYKVDSMGGVRSFNINRLSGMKNIGILLPRPLKLEWEEKIRNISYILKKESIYKKSDLIHYLRRLNINKQILGDLEIPIGVAVSILETNICNTSNKEFAEIYRVIDLYNDFISQLTNGNYNDINMILKYVPDIIIGLLRLR